MVDEEARNRDGCAIYISNKTCKSQLFFIDLEVDTHFFGAVKPHSMPYFVVQAMGAVWI